MTLKLEERTAHFELSKCLVQEASLLAGRNENDDLLLLMRFQEGIQGVDLFFWLHQHVILGEFSWSFVDVAEGSFLGVGFGRVEENSLRFFEG